MTKSYRKNIDRKIKVKFLNPAESNRGELTKLISLYQKSLLVPSAKSPYLGSDSTYRILDKTSQIPESPKGSAVVFRQSLSFLKRSLRWHSPNCLQNVTPPVVFESLAIGLMANLYNLNMIWDHVSAGGHSVEKQVTGQLARLAAWGDSADGLFTYGGKGCHTYAIKMGLSRCLPDIATQGIRGPQPVVITSKYNHYIIENVCSLLNLGTKSCIKVDTDNNEIIDLLKLETTLIQLLDKSTPIACIILSGGSTINLNIDPVSKVKALVDKLVQKYNLPYAPFIYFDSVVGWPWLFFKDYDFTGNKLNIKSGALKKIKEATKLIQQVKYADAMGVDFHKIGFASYSNSAIIVKNAQDLHSINSPTKKLVKRQEFGNNFLQHHTLEHSRSAAPIFSAWAILQGMGKDGFRLYLANLTEVADVFRDKLGNGGFNLINPYSLCFGPVFLPIAPGGPKNYSELMALTDEELNKSNQYVYDLSKYLSNYAKNKIAQIEVGFLKTLVRPPENRPFSVIRIYPMSPFLDRKSALNIAQQIILCKEKFDKLQTLSHSKMPNVVHR